MKTGAMSCWAAMEKAAVRATHASVERKEHVLMIRTKRKTVLFTDRPGVRYLYFGFYADLGYHLVPAMSNGGEMYSFISERSGNIIEMGAVPRVSPARSHVVSVAASESDDNNEVVVWRNKSGELEQEYQYRPQGYALYQFLSWTGETRVNVEVFTRSNPRLCPNHPFMQQREIIELKGSQWTRTADPSPQAIRCQ